MDNWETIDIQKIRAAHERQPHSIAPGASAEPHRGNDIPQVGGKSSGCSAEKVFTGSIGTGKTICTNAIIKKMEEFSPHNNFYIVEDVPELQYRG